MKFCFLLLAVLGFSIKESDGQVRKDSASNQASYNYYNDRAKSQLTAGRVLLLSGVGLQLISLGIAVDHLFGETPSSVPVLFGTGTVMLLGGIPLIVIGNKNRKAAKKFKVAMQMQSIHSLKKMNWQTGYYPALSLKLSL